ncbi:MAG TPA: OpgC domain-containing protein [Aliidongia sp.]|uniref:OpgC family protein n=1 Tax=Aliidongia sp. TaxID=1914230 RepID=UPI002DDDA708|nr:OpgC domain-containing protein [Aliidongia sp.]HEV2675535.1 OpgC domain-containing protein [Aliidongia sp.]
MASPGNLSRRDSRVDLLRGIALLTIFVDHVPGNLLGNLTFRNFGFSDAAELFVVLAGFSSMMAYGGCFERNGTVPGLRRIGARCLRIYLVQMGLLAATLAIIWLWDQRFGLDTAVIQPILDRGMRSGMTRGLILEALPAYLDILPLYVVLIGIFPLVYLLMRWNPVVALALSGGIWLATNLDPELNLPNTVYARLWFLDPFAWQFLFTIGIGMAMVMRRRDGRLPIVPGLRIAAWVYLAFALLVAAPWRIWGLWDVQLLAVPMTDKTILAPLRLMNILAFVYLALTSDGLRALAARPLVAPIIACGKHSLEVFAIGTILSLIGRLLFETFGTPLSLQLIVNGVGFTALFWVGWVLEIGRTAPQPAPHLPEIRPGV